MTAEGIAKRLGGQRCGSEWLARCPAHEDRKPSLSLRGANGKLLFRCHAGCTQQAVMAALKDLGLWPERKNLNPVLPKRRIVAAYDYRDGRGNLLYQVVRTDPKGFFQRQPDGHGGWILKKHPQQVLYRLPEVLEAPIVFLAEGERDVETLRQHGFVATTNAGGANSLWLPVYTQALKDREIIILPDDDGPGLKRAVTIARALHGAVKRLAILRLEDGKDITEWFERGHSEVELIEQLDPVGVGS